MIKTKIYFYSILMFFTGLIFIIADSQYLTDVLLLQGFLGLFDIIGAIYKEIQKPKDNEKQPRL